MWYLEVQAGNGGQRRAILRGDLPQTRQRPPPHNCPCFGSGFRASDPSFGYRKPLLVSRFGLRIQVSGTGFRISDPGLRFGFRSGFRVQAIPRRHASAPRRTTAPAFAIRVSGTGVRLSDPDFGCRLPAFYPGFLAQASGFRIRCSGSGSGF